MKQNAILKWLHVLWIGSTLLVWIFSRAFCQSNRDPAGLPEDGEGQEGAGELQQVGHDVRDDLPGQGGLGQRHRAEQGGDSIALTKRLKKCP